MYSKDLLGYFVYGHKIDVESVYVIVMLTIV